MALRTIPTPELKRAFFWYCAWWRVLREDIAWESPGCADDRFHAARMRLARVITEREILNPQRLTDYMWAEDV
jgi:hypothetical protein